MRVDTYDDEGRLRRRADDQAKRVTVWDADGEIVQERDYKPAEVAEARQREQELAVDRAASATAAIAAARDRLTKLEAQIATDPQRVARVLARLQGVLRSGD